MVKYADMSIGEIADQCYLVVGEQDVDTLVKVFLLVLVHCEHTDMSQFVKHIPQDD